MSECNKLCCFVQDGRVKQYCDAECWNCHPEKKPDERTYASKALKEIQDRLKDLEYRLNHFVEFPRELDVRLEDVERRIDKLADSHVEMKAMIVEINRFQDIACEQYKFNTKNKPHKCPVCDGHGLMYLNHMCTQQMLSAGWQADSMGMAYRSCVSCEGKGIVWR